MVRQSRRQFLTSLAAAALPTSLHSRAQSLSATTHQPIFTDVTDQAGIVWRNFDGESKDRYLIEAMGGGVAFFDFDRDGLLDIFFVNGGETPNGKSSRPLRNALYRNLGNGKFQDVTIAAGVDRIPFYGMGVAAGDYNNDGFPDLFVTGYPSCALFHNNGNGTFTDVTEKAGLRNSGLWAASAAWFDYDRDGRLDLIVCNYVQFSYGEPINCEYRGMRVYCEQRDYEGLPLALYHNNGDGTFTNVSVPSGLHRFVGRALGVVSIDVDDDGWPDLFVARDASPNLLLINQRNGHFENVAMDAEVAYDEDGRAKSGMGVDAGDVNNDGRPDFVVTNFNDEFHSLFINPGSFPFDDWTLRSHLAAYTRTDVGWGTHFIDYDNNGDLDLVIVNGHINQFIGLARADVTYKEFPLLLRNNGSGVFQNIQQQAGPTFEKPYPARGLAVGDFNNDGGIDIVFTRLNEKPILLRNNVGRENSWIGFKLEGTKSNRDAIGAKLTIKAGDKQRVKWITGGSSYLSSHDQRVVFGLGGKPAPRSVDLEIRWPTGESQRLRNFAPNRYYSLREPRGSSG